MKRLCRAALLILALICACPSCNYSEDYEKIADRITDQTGKKLQRERGLFLIGTGGG